MKYNKCSFSNGLYYHLNWESLGVVEKTNHRYP